MPHSVCMRLGEEGGEPFTSPEVPTKRLHSKGSRVFLRFSIEKNGLPTLVPRPFSPPPSSRLTSSHQHSQSHWSTLVFSIVHYTPAHTHTHTHMADDDVKVYSLADFIQKPYYTIIYNFIFRSEEESIIIL